jgi:hypothetical protein
MSALGQNPGHGRYGIQRQPPGCYRGCRRDLDGDGEQRYLLQRVPYALFWHSVCSLRLRQARVQVRLTVARSWPLHLAKKATRGEPAGHSG